MAKKKQAFEEQLQRLEQIREALDTGEVPVEDMLKLYEEGMSLAKEAREYLQNAELKVIEINKQNSSTE